MCNISYKFYILYTFQINIYIRYYRDLIHNMSTNIVIICSVSFICRPAGIFRASVVYPLLRYRVNVVRRERHRSHVVHSGARRSRVQRPSSSLPCRTESPGHSVTLFCFVAVHTLRSPAFSIRDSPHSPC